MRNYVTSRTDNETNDKLNEVFDFSSLCMSDSILVPDSVSTANLSSSELLQIQLSTLYNFHFLGRETQESESSLFVEFFQPVKSFASRFSTVLFSKDFKIYM